MTERLLLLLPFILGLTALACSSSEDVAPVPGQQKHPEAIVSREPHYSLQVMPEFSINLSSESVSQRGRLGKDYTCEGFDYSPHLSWSSVPEGTESFVVILEDREPEGLFVELEALWILYSIPTNLTELQERLSLDPTLENGAVHGTNSYGNTYYNGPCPRPTILNNPKDPNDPPVVAGLRAYYFTIYAIDKEIVADPGLSRDALLKEVDGHILAAGEIAPKFRSLRKVTHAYRSGSIGRVPGR